ncbi:MAG: glycosyltransferase family 2 protein [Sulfitobacter sp.]
MTDQPAASFILVSYNQQDTVAESARAVLAQDCSPLQIILSDDASTDKTFDVLKEVAASYSGPHSVQVRQNPHNLGVNKHMSCAIELAECDFLIWSAGDDVSVPQRARTILKAYEETKAKLIFSDAQTQRPDGSPGTETYRKALFYRPEYTVEQAATSFALFLGAAVGWHKDLYYKYGGFPPDRAHEDLILGFRAALEDSVHYIPEKLVTYREDVGVSSHLSGKTSTLQNRARRTAILKGQFTVLQQRVIDAQTFGLASDHPIFHALHTLRDWTSMRLSYYEGNKAAHARQPVRLAHALLSEWLRDFRNR